MSENSAIINTGGGTVNAQGAVMGSRNTVTRESGPKARRRRADVGVITILPVEMRAVLSVLGISAADPAYVDPSGAWFYETTRKLGSRVATVAVTRALSQGQRSAVVTFEKLTRAYAPSLVVLAGIAGGVAPKVELGDVVVANQAIYYDLRKETPGGTRHRGQPHEVPARVLHAVNAFFNVHGEPYVMEGGRSVRSGPIGTGEAVVADAGSEILRYLATVNDKTLALETEAGGVAQAFYEEMDGHRATLGWLAVRGISDYADEHKNDDWHLIAATNAALVLESLLPFLLRIGPSGQQEGS
ncbi:hypothetical protein [Nonomuraea sp. NPDC050643]|uniref:5'-methylthioadenosine/S-adenosylhomocysteine nucleosidase family protein n=1 Tax=Nonomuraea sp. NPDC050643 TaxID=3155660 RepID=UPI0033F84D13